MADDTTTAELANSLEDFLARSYDSATRRAVLSERRVTELGGVLGEMGVFATSVPEVFGGLGLPMASLGPLFTLYGRYLVPGPLLENSLLPAVLAADAPETARAVFKAAMSGDGQLALVDPHATGDWDGGSITVRNGRLFGRCHLVRFGGDATQLVVVSDDQQSWLVDPHAGGLEMIQTDANADPLSSFASVGLDGVAGTPLADASAAPRLIEEIRSWVRTLVACELSGIAAHCVRTTIDYAKEREQFGRPIGSYQAIKHIIADMHVHAASVRNLCDSVLADTVNSGAPTAVDAAVLKAHASKVAVEVCQDAIQVHGGIGFTAEVDLHWFYKRALALRPWYGDTRTLEEMVGAAALAQTTEHASTAKAV
ncbi:hypothetical protein LQ384_27050 [Rhodococcus rhodochrous]|uniref:Acyl-CoA dehydrogenase/oxidase C-terminal domain-containing protein n=1 Tax=Rhodococcus rhodochrous TaxID=1829 RepID=A0AAW4XPF4_RHORH|nr:acyl-CoA dehydrogenase family protein [Rhodococcus rhodochrous]KLL96960.1 hypothetical protein NJ76_08260 [Rhodococcus sp. IITR03]MCD2114764.1 hypothetical protein [Rhodococcus rhodochrous]